MTKIVQMDTTKEGIKSYLEIAAEKNKVLWHSQEAHKVAVGIFAMDCAGLTEKEDRAAFMKQWLATPSSFGSNASAMGQALGRPKASAKLETLMADY